MLRDRIENILGQTQMGAAQLRELIKKKDFPLTLIKTSDGCSYLTDEQTSDDIKYQFIRISNAYSMDALRYEDVLINTNHIVSMSNL